MVINLALLMAESYSSHEILAMLYNDAH